MQVATGDYEFSVDTRSGGSMVTVRFVYSVREHGEDTRYGVAYAVSKLISSSSDKNVRPTQSFLTRAASYFLTQHNRFCDFFHASPLLPALALNAEVGLFFSQSEIALQNSF